MESTSQKQKRHQFDNQFKLLVRPALVAKGFAFGEKRTFRRTIQLDGWTAIQIVGFQLGMKSLVGRFTANVGVFARKFHPEDWHAVGDLPSVADCLPAMRRRLGYFFDPPQSWFVSVFRRSNTKPERHDYWWEQHADERKMAQNIQSTLGCLESGALPWLDALSCQDAFNWAVSELKRAKKWKESQGAPGAEPHFDLRYFTDIS